jgi:Na+-translocating ferredoxin:NAD+ oxidoreductase RNF subunit RnfB
MNGIVIAALVVGIVGIIIGLLLGVAGEVFKVEVDEREVAVRAELPGNNCGGCGYAGCDGLAAAIVKGEEKVNQCPVGGSAVSEKIAAIMGVENNAQERKVAFVKCQGIEARSEHKYNYYGIDDCLKAVVVPGQGGKACTYGCLGLGSCVKACQFHALDIVNGIAKVNEDACVACGQCAEVCPRNLIDLIPASAKHRVICNSSDRGKDMKYTCSGGCIGCKRCVKACEHDAIHVVDNHAIIDYEKCVECGACAEVCKREIIAK